jgi:Group II intron, maturase-specific domain
MQGTIFTGFLPAASRDAILRMLRTVKGWQLQRQTPATIEEFSERYNPVLRGWWNYYGSFYPSVLDRISFQVDRKLARWARRKHKRMAGHRKQSAQSQTCLRQEPGDAALSIRRDGAIRHPRQAGASRSLGSS